ncbi:MAG: ROK family protein [Planctomycetia bacterium]|nr:ROK family protein [Planctomycetia bacterium]
MLRIGGAVVNILVIDIGGTKVKIWKSGEGDSEKFVSGKRLTPRRLLDRVAAHTRNWHFDRVSLGYPGEVRNGHPNAEAFNLGPGWVDFDWGGAFECPLKIMNDACMQALGSYEGGRMLYLGLGTGLGSAFIFEGQIIPLALGHLRTERKEDFSHYLGRDGLKAHGKKVWREVAIEAALAFKAAFLADYVVFGGGNAKRLGKLPEGCRKGGNHNAYFGGLRLWHDAHRGDGLRLAVVPAVESARAAAP